MQKDVNEYEYEDEYEIEDDEEERDKEPDYDEEYHEPNKEELEFIDRFDSFKSRFYATAEFDLEDNHDRLAFTKEVLNLKNIYDEIRSRGDVGAVDQDYLLGFFRDAKDYFLKTKAPSIDANFALDNGFFDHSVQDVYSKTFKSILPEVEKNQTKGPHIVTIRSEEDNISKIDEEKYKATFADKDPERLANAIVKYNELKETHKNRSFFTKVKQFFTGNKEKKALDDFEKTIRAASGLSEKFMDAAFKNARSDDLELKLYDEIKFKGLLFEEGVTIESKPNQNNLSSAEIVDIPDEDIEKNENISYDRADAELQNERSRERF